MKILIYIISFLCILNLNAQDRVLENYYPKYNDPDVAIKIKLHIIQHSAKDPKNYRKSDTLLLQEQVKLINSFYQFLDYPTLEPPANTAFLADSKIRFVLKSIQFYVDSILWDRISFLPFRDGKYPLTIDSVNVLKNEIYFTDNYFQKFKKGAQILIENDLQNSGIYKSDTCYYDRTKNTTVLKLDKKLKSSPKGSKITFYSENNYNCSNDIWQNLLGGDQNYLHVIYTGSSLKALAFGCGPSPYFLNVSSFINGGDWANAQLAAHELGHCIGLNHTDNPQFDDLPRRDKFGFIECDSVEVSNNIMGYNKCRRYLSPKQIAYVHMLYNTDPNRIKTTIYCQYNWKNSITVNKNLVWNRAYVVGGDLIIRKNKTLHLKGMISMPRNGKIILEDGAKIIVDGTTITNSCGESWGGIVYCKKYKGGKTKLKTPKKKGSIEFKNGGKLEHVNKI